MLDLEKLKKNVVHMLNQTGTESKCKGCGARIWWVEHRNGKRAPYTETGLNHFIDCPKAKDFKK